MLAFLTILLALILFMSLVAGVIYLWCRNQVVVIPNSPNRVHLQRRAYRIAVIRAERNQRRIKDLHKMKLHQEQMALAAYKIQYPEAFQ